MSRRQISKGLLMVMFMVSTGCFYAGVPKMGRLYLSGNFAELEQHLEKKEKGEQALEHEELAYLCAAYWKLKKYDKFFACAERMEASLKRGKPEVSWLLWDVSYSHLWGTAYAYIELGDYAKAVEWAAKSYEIGRQKQLDVFHEVYSLSALALAYAFSGDRANALKYAALLEKVKPRNPSS